MPHVDGLAQDDSLIAALSAAAAGQTVFLATNPDRDAIASSRSEMEAGLAAIVDEDALAQFQVLLNTIELWDAERLGYSDLASWEAMRDTLSLMGFVDDDGSDLRDAFTNDFVAGIDA